MLHLGKLPPVFIFVLYLSMCESLYLRDGKQLVTNKNVELTNHVNYERLFLKIKNYYTKFGVCPKGMNWYRGRCTFKTHKEDYKHKFPVYDGVATTKRTTMKVDINLVRFKTSEDNTLSAPANENKTDSNLAFDEYRNIRNIFERYMFCVVLLLLFVVAICAKVFICSSNKSNLPV